MEAKKYRVTCLNCKHSSLLNIVNEQQVIYIDHLPIISARLRGDLKWGWECICGNDSRLAREEAPQAEMLVAGSSAEIIKQVIGSLEYEDKSKFAMELV